MPWTFPWINRINKKDIYDATDVNSLAKGIQDSAAYTQTQLDLKANKSGNETITGIKTFSQFPHSPASLPLTDYELVNKKYVDLNSGGVGGSEVTYAVDIGAVNAYAIAPSPAITAYRNGMHISVLIANTNTSATCTMDVNSLGVCPIYLIADGSRLPEIAEIRKDNIYDFTYNNGAFILQ